MRLPDPARSRAVLLGTSTFTDPELPDLPGVRNNLTDLAAVLTSDWATALPREHCVVLSDESDRGIIGGALNAAAAQAQDLLLVYYAGHGLIGRAGSLYLSLPNTRSAREMVEWTAFPFGILRDTLAGAQADNRVLILDCCFSGLAIDLMTDVSSAVAGQLEVAGTCTLTSSPANQPSRAPASARFTAYTGEMLELLHRGPADDAELLTITAIHEHLSKVLPSKGYPRPEQRNTRTIGRLALSRKPPPSVRTGEELDLEAEHLVLHPPSTSLDPETHPLPNPSAPTAQHRARPLEMHSAPNPLAWDPWTIRSARGPNPPPSHGGGIQTSPISRRSALIGGAALLAAGAGAVAALWPDSTADLDRYSQVVYTVAFSPDGALLATGSNESTVRLWDAKTRQETAPPIKGHSEKARAVAFSPDGALLATGGDDNTVRLWDVKTRQQVAQPISTDGSVRSLAFSPDGTLLAAAGTDGFVLLWNMKAGSAFWQIANTTQYGPYTGTIETVAFSPDGARITTSLWVWDLTTHQLVEHLPNFNGNLYSAVYRPDGALLVTGHEDGEIRFWDTNTYQLVGQSIDAVFAGGRLPVALSPDGTRLVGSATGGRFQIWDAATRQPIGQPLDAQAVTSYSVAFSPDGTQIAAGVGGNSGKGAVLLWQVLPAQ
ncbi:WD40 repeat domain-containing protein [Nocardia barduliensis]|uniref:WD40 repeat domain-containing protein n=1 Tax=Nocardia barduliensis TaxID=2736643 RepID=UPI00157251CE|nr:WD40 repeat domain-containing protein [Nocardia barduliensis]